jgi:tetratricopeptide (TPR) repeat protein
MCRRASLALLSAAAALAAASASCHTCENHDLSKFLLEEGKRAYSAASFSQAKIFFGKALENCSDNYDALVGLGNACREYGNELYRNCNFLLEQRKTDEYRKEFQKANQNHAECDQYLRAAIKLKPDDLLPRYGLGLLWYNRATAPIAAPWIPADGTNRRADRDRAIDEFSRIVQKHPQAYEARKYLAMVLLAAGRLDDTLPHLKAYHDSRQALYEGLLKWPQDTEEAKKRKEAALAHVEKEIADVRDILTVAHQESLRERDALSLKPGRTAAEEQRLGAATRQALALENMIRSFVIVHFGEVELALRERCEMYFALFNKGDLDFLLAQVEPRLRELESVRRAYADRIGEGTQFRNVRYRTISVSVDGASAGVTLVSNIVSKKGTQADRQVSLRWRQVDGQWLVSEDGEVMPQGPPPPRR